MTLDGMTALATLGPDHNSCAVAVPVVSKYSSRIFAAVPAVNPNVVLWLLAPAVQ